ncbi:unnamed protein product [Amoebophrya sp. A25]|nr:unnamed protein product [Amoebophrya sp. A25]|eukprot:GSA25T00014757001.1
MDNRQAAPPAAVPAPAAAAARPQPAAAAAASSSSTSNSRLGAPGSTSAINSTLCSEQPQKKTLSDVLVRAGEGFENWKKTIVELDSEEIARRQAQQDANCSRKLSMAQINTWITLAKFRSRGSSGRVDVCNFPMPLKFLVRDFLGEQIQQLSALAAEEKARQSRLASFATDAVEKRRSADRLRAANYYLGYIHTQAAQGVHRVPITTEICAAAPKMSTGEPVRLDIVFRIISRKSDYSYAVLDGEGEPIDFLDDANVVDDLLDPSTSRLLPLFIGFKNSVAPNAESAFHAVNAVEQLERGRRNVSSGPTVHTIEAINKPYLRTLVEVIAETQRKAAEFLVQRFKLGLAHGSTSLQVTSELIEGLDYPKLPNGNICPLSHARLCSEVHKSISDYDSLFWQILIVDNKTPMDEIDYKKADTDGGTLRTRTWVELTQMEDPLPFTIALKEPPQN